MPDSLAEALAAAQSENVSLAMAALQVEQADERKRAAAADRWPTVDLIGARRYEENFNSLEGVGHDYSILLSLNWHPYTGSRTSSAMAAAAARREQAQRAAEDARRQVTEDVTRSFDALDTARRRTTMLENARVIAEEVFEARVKLRQAGKDTALNVLDARSDIFTAEMNLTSARFDAEQATLRLLAAIGRLTPATLGIDASTALDESN